MTLVDLDEGAAGQLKPGDTVLIRGTVVQALDGVGVEVELFSKTDQYTAWVRLDHVAALVLPDVPPEPGDGTWIPARNTDDGGVHVFHRHDAEVPVEPDRRFPRRWQVAGTGEWVDWPTAVHRGADQNRRLYPTPPVVVPEPVVDAELIRAVERFLVRGGSGTPGKIRSGVVDELRCAGLDREVSVEQVERALRMLRGSGRARVGDVVGGVVTQWVHAEPRD